MGWILFSALLVAQLVLIELGFAVFSKLGRRIKGHMAFRLRDEVPVEQEFAAHPILIEARSNLKENHSQRPLR
jgi:hypothetical protein